MTTYESQPTPMRASEFALDFISEVEASGAGDTIGLSTMQIAPQPDIATSRVEQLIDEIIAASERGADTSVSIDAAYANRMTRIGNRDFPNFLPLISAENSAERERNREIAGEILAKLATHGLLVESGVRPIDRGYTPRLRQIGSIHPFQLLAARHVKAAHIMRENGEAMAWITSANLTESDLTDPNPNTGIGMNNLAFRINGNLARFTARSLEDGFGHTSGTHRYENGSTTIVHDVNNSGEPARLPGILQEALITIDPRRSEKVPDPTTTKPKSATHVVLLSQYLPDGLLYSALEQSSRHADVHLPRQPLSDHRARSFPYNIHSFVQGHKIDRSEIVSSRRKVPSHVKVMVTKYDNGTARIIGGTDNFVTHLQKFIRNEELAVIIDLDLKSDDEFMYFDRFVSLINDMGEISDSVRDDLVA